MMLSHPPASGVCRCGVPSPVLITAGGAVPSGAAVGGVGKGLKNSSILHLHSIGAASLHSPLCSPTPHALLISWLISF